jgi:hypothetical protein
MEANGISRVNGVNGKSSDFFKSRLLPGNPRTDPIPFSPDVTILNSAAPPATLRLLIGALIVGAVICSLRSAFYSASSKRKTLAEEM